MPIYEYHCESCNSDFERLVLSKVDPNAECPECSGNNVKRLLSVGCFRPNGIPTGSGGFKEPNCKPSGG
jgi:putative FmdB family regulatory protein